jgi:hypothetical protein
MFVFCLFIIHLLPHNSTLHLHNKDRRIAIYTMEHVALLCANSTILTNPPSAENTELVIKLVGKVKFILEQAHRGLDGE